MDFAFTEEQDLLRGSVRAFLRDTYGFADRMAAARSRGGWRPEIWTALASELGILGIGVPIAEGGCGGGAIERMIVMEEFGGALVIEPYVETAVIAVRALAAAGTAHARAALDEIVAGQSVVAFAWAEPTMRDAPEDIETRARRDGHGWRIDGRKAVVTAVPWADRLLVAARSGGSVGEHRGLSLFLVDKDARGIVTHDYPTIDGRRASDIMFDNVALPADALIGEEGEAFAVIGELMDHGIAAIAAEAVGAMRRLHADTLGYLRQRRQFGKPLAEFQALQHRMVDMFMRIEMANAATLLATLKLGGSPSERARAASAAKVTIGEAGRFVGQASVQLHGGMGMTDELAIGHYFKRLTMIEGEFGATDYHLARHADLSDLWAS